MTCAECAETVPEYRKITMPGTNRVVTHPHRLSPPVLVATDARMPAEALMEKNTKVR